jgi:hypothetical protein
VQQEGMLDARALAGESTHAFNRARTVSNCSFSEAPTPMRMPRSSVAAPSLQSEG